MEKKIIGIFVFALLIIPATMSVSGNNIDNEKVIENSDPLFEADFIFGRIFSLEEEEIMGEVHYSFNVISVRLLFFVYTPPISFGFHRDTQNGGQVSFPKDKFIGHISENFILGVVSGWHYN